MSQKELKEAFVSNLNGTSLLEISAGLSLPPLCLLCRGLLLILHHLHHGKPVSSRKYSLLLDFLVLVSPLLFSCTVLSPILFFIPLLLAAFCAGIFSRIYSRRKAEARAPLGQVVEEFRKARLDPGCIPAITVFRVYVNVLTSISILAVDFPQYPRRYAKAETYGTGVMDLGVGAFIFGNALVCPEVRQQPHRTQARFSSLARQVFSIWPLISLGFGRLLSVKSIEYHEHTSEYGLHWNFFFTLALVRLAASLLLAVFPKHRAGLVAAALAVLYQLLLSTTSLKAFILHGSDGRDSRLGFLDANREGLLSLFGYLAIYLASVQVGLWLQQPRGSVRGWLGALRALALALVALWVLLQLCQACSEPVSRRMANLPFCIWVLAHCLLLLGFFLLADLALVFTKLLVKGAGVPCCWELVQPLNSRKKHGVEAEQGKLSQPCLISAINKNQLLFFLLANVMTGAVNILVDTIHSKAAFTLCVLHLYMFLNCLVMDVLHARNIVLKFW
ncbi:phosphatidylinositol-glycan biosynthesis class W protein isoform X1 [Chamaea fasciata]|uniref:phosphatidylinositol-glycan biosynthesis class W protein isoform X1 n=1 Tax=Chamaea fasciata TaxID=190680 RepID=UPI00336AA240